ncbi:MAG TPA: M20/M25/M40 family metallo-hydrolase [Candidatus Egerieimonas intestinavium]|uniref:M20/M25/M40 family metallo-hydrolase n=1 Tax=Candidatus Egerieimonas intestinavium TaxID=2840777 RepID=A0A9D1JF26_9FIRM|nr:M20/M25/M40 family metallo-hydrolase [Candidatus Egerieimonas intestinavium]
MKKLIAMPAVQEALAFLKEDDGQTLKEQLEMCGIPAPSHQEKDRADYCLKKFQEIGLEDVHMDEVYNVFGTIPGKGTGPRLMLAAHTDTVFPAGTDLTVRKEGNRYYCPGINDDTRSVAELFSIARAMKKYQIQGQGDIVFCANVCEEGLGDLKGVKYIFGRDTYDGFVSIDNPVPGGIVYTATGSRRFRITFRGSGGHSFADFGIPNPIHAMGRAISRIADWQVPQAPKTTFNVGVVEGGTSVNTIAGETSLLLDIRSDSPQELERLTQEMRLAADWAAETENSRWAQGQPMQAEVVQLGERPAGTQDKDCQIVRAAWDAAEVLGMEAQLRDESSTDANIPISLGIPAITVGRGGNEGGVHTIHEWFEPEEAYLGPQKNMLLMLALSGLDDFLDYQLPKRG